MRLIAWSVMLASCHSSFACADETCHGVDDPYVVNIRVDNDIFGGAGQDQGYTNGAVITSVSPNIADYVNDPCLAPIARWINRHFERLRPGEFEQQNMIVSVEQGMYTPTDFRRADLIADDRPYAAVVMLGIGYNARNGDHLRSTHLRVGMVGPSARGEQVQNAVHDMVGGARFEGWDHQLRDEPLVQLVHERMRRWSEDRDGNASGWGWDMIGHAGGGLGNFATYANAGAELRLGWRLPDDFGSSTQRPAGENTAPTRLAADGSWAWHLFLSLDASAVLRDITLDGNTFKSSHSVDKRTWIATAGLGMAVTHERWKFAVAHYYRTREFDGQEETPVFGSFSISRAF